MSTLSHSLPTATPPTATPPTATGPAPTRVAPPAIPFGRLVRVEAHKMVDTRAGLGLVVTLALVTAAAVLVTLFNAPAEQLSFAVLVGATTLPQAIVLPILGILATTGEWSQRTALVTFALEPRRVRVAAAKLVSAWLVGLVAVALALALAALCNVVGRVFLDGSGVWNGGDLHLAALVFGQLVAVTEGVALGLAIQHSAAAIAVCLALPTAWTITVTLVPALHEVAPWVDLNSATWALWASDIPAVAWAHLATALTLWVGLPLVLGLLRLTRCELK